MEQREVTVEKEGTWEEDLEALARELNKGGKGLYACCSVTASSKEAEKVVQARSEWEGGGKGKGGGKAPGFKVRAAGRRAL
jgi:hypothetical protein